MRIINDPDLLQALAEGKPYDVTVTVTPVGGSPVVIDGAHMTEGGVSINPSSVSNNKLELGSVIAATGDFEFFNYDGALDGIAFKGAELHVEGSMTVNGVTETFDIGYFIADDAKNNGRKINVQCFDRMILFDKTVPSGSGIFPNPIKNIISAACTACGVTCATDLTTLTNGTYQVPAAPEGTYTYRQLISWAAQIAGKCCKINNEGELELVWYEAVTEWEAALDNRFEGGILAENAITLSGVKVKVSGVTSYLAGADGYTLDIIDNPLLQTAFTTEITNVWNEIGALSYYTAQFSVVHNVLAEPFDIIDYTDEDGTVYSVAVTDVILNMTARTQMQSKGISMEEAAYAAQDPFNAAQSEQIADATRLKIGRIESQDGKVYFDLDSGDIVTDNTTERVISQYGKAEYQSVLSFANGVFTVEIFRSGTSIGKLNFGTNGIEVTMDSTQGVSFPKPEGWDDWPNAIKQTWWLGHSIVNRFLNGLNTVDNSITITDQGSSLFSQANLAAGKFQTTLFDPDAATGTRSWITPDGLEAQKLNASSVDMIKSKSEYKHDYANVYGTIHARTGMRIGGLRYDSADALDVATEEYVDNKFALAADYVVETGTSGDWTYKKWSSGLIEFWANCFEVTLETYSDWYSGLKYASGNIMYPFTMQSVESTNVQVQIVTKPNATESNGIVLIALKYVDRARIRFVSKNQLPTTFADIYVKGYLSNS